MNWSASEFFERVTKANKLAQQLGAKFCRVSGLNGFQDCLASLRSANCIVAVSDISQGNAVLSNAPHNERMKVIYMAMRHPVDDMIKREKAMDNMRELFRQFCSWLLQERTQLQEENLIISDEIHFNEIDKYFFSGMACAFFQIHTYSYCSMELNPDEWLWLPEKPTAQP